MSCRPATLGRRVRMHRATPRRAFLGQLAMGTTALAASRRAAATDSSTVSASPPATQPAGDLARRVDLTARRLTETGVPAYTADFVLADVALDTRRRFWNFSGDLSGRWIEALAALPPAGRSAADLAPLVARLLSHQRPDGRFGRTDLAFTAADTGTEHMALLWGNGRLLVGLMAYWEATHDTAVLAAARRLAAFVLAVREATKAPEVTARVEGQGAFGFICFTQLAEGLALLTQATGDASYAAAGREIVPLLQPRGVQHSHGYLTTLRGALLLHEIAGHADMLAFVERLYGELVRSTDYTIDGGVLEYFGWGDPTSSASLAAAKAASGVFPRNEGCGLADFVRLSLQLHRATGRVEYLERAERCLVNGFAHNQFANGDFGSRVFFDQGIQPSPSVDRAWWCCTMHGYRAFRDVINHAVVEKDGTVAVQLFEDLDFGGTRAALRVRRTPGGLRCEVTSAFEGVLAFREPSWADRAALSRDGGPPATKREAGFLRVEGRFAAGERIEVRLVPRLRLLTPKGEEVALSKLGSDPVRAALCCGPWLLVADEQIDPVFFGEPWPGNTVTLPRDLAPRAGAAGRLRLAVTYEHEGFRGSLPTELRPMGETPADEQKTIAFWLNYRRA
ncbi:MAG TPA: beta-L-arabinofuranosidase domain-containing protein [Vicinamibacteria bacterium]|nr:beta-L-arabinofuranosidase domain-containing protein [Vicinamibacteria bacterium]